MFLKVERFELVLEKYPIPWIYENINMKIRIQVFINLTF